jgi:hypothetical protein
MTPAIKYDHLCPSETEHVGTEQFKAWLKTAQPGAMLVYATGDLMRCRLECGALDQLAQFVWHTAKAGKVHLTQRRIGDGIFEHRAEVASAKKKTVAEVKP